MKYQSVALGCLSRNSKKLKYMREKKVRFNNITSNRTEKENENRMQAYIVSFLNVSDMTL